MKSHSKCTVIITLSGLFLGLAVFLMQVFGAIRVNSNDIFYIIMVTAGDVTVLGLLGLSIYSSNKADKHAAFCKCGNLSAIGAIGTMAAPLITSIINQSDYMTLYRIGVSSCFFFLTLLLGELWCTYYTYNHCVPRHTQETKSENLREKHPS